MAYCPPDRTKEYVVTQTLKNDMPPAGTIVRIAGYNKRSGMFEITEIETGEAFQTHYGWQLAEATPKNMKKIGVFWKAQEKVAEAERAMRFAMNAVDMVLGPSEKSFKEEDLASWET